MGLDAPGDGPDEHLGGTAPKEGFSTGVGGRPGGHDVIDQDYFLVFNPAVRSTNEGIADIGRALLQSQPGLGLGGFDTEQAISVQRNTGKGMEGRSEAFRLVEAALAAFGWMQRHRDKHIPTFFLQPMFHSDLEQTGQEWFEPNPALILIAVNNIKD